MNFVKLLHKNIMQFFKGPPPVSDRHALPKLAQYKVQKNNAKRKNPDAKQQMPSYLSTVERETSNRNIRKYMNKINLSPLIVFTYVLVTAISFAIPGQFSQAQVLSYYDLN